MTQPSLRDGPAPPDSPGSGDRRFALQPAIWGHVCRLSLLGWARSVGPAARLRSRKPGSGSRLSMVGHCSP